MTLSQAFDLYNQNVIAFKNQSRKTEEQHHYALKSLVTYIGNPEIDTLTFEQVRLYKHALERRGLSQGTIRGYLNKLTVVLAYLQKSKIDCLDPDLIPLPKRENKPIDFLTQEEVALLIRVAGKKARGYPEISRLRNQAIISLLYGSGIRISEMCRLDRGAIYHSTFTAHGKGNKNRPAFIDQRTAILLDKYLKMRQDSSPALFLSNQTGGRVTSGSVQKVMRELGIKAGFKKPIHPHLLRHSFATNLLFNNTNPRYVQALLGHSSLDTTMIYMTVVDEDLKAVYEKHHTI